MADALQSMPRQALFSPGELTERVIAEKQGAIGWITLNNPARRNAMSLDMWEAIPKVLERMDADADLRVVVLTGAGDKAFVSGADISQFENQRSSADAVQYYEEICEQAQQRLQTCDKPVLARIRGFCLGGGINLAVASDIRLAADDASFSVPSARMGIGYRASSTKNLVDTVGVANAREMLITARRFSAAEAVRMGLVHRVVPAAELDALVLDYCTTIAGNAPLSMRTSKRIIRELLGCGQAFDAAACEALVKECFASQDYTEGRRAFMEKRRPEFKGR